MQKPQLYLVIHSAHFSDLVELKILLRYYLWVKCISIFDLESISMVCYENLIVPLLVCYVIGSIPCGVIIARIFELGDLQHQGSGNIGGTNVARIGGKVLGALTIVLDIAKGIIAMSIVQHEGCSKILLVVLGGITVLGHVFPIWLKFKGGKGVATTAGVLTIIDPNTAVIFISTWIIVLASFNVSSLSSITAIVLSLIWSLFMSPQSIFVVYLIWFGILLYKHKDNVKRLCSKDEHKI